MKRYFISVILAIFAVSSLGAYFIHGAMDDLPEFKLEFLQGNKEIGKSIQLEGVFYGRMKHEYVEITESGSKYQRDRSVIDEIRYNRSHIYDLPGVRELLDEHRGFMRGKLNPRSLYADQEYVIYAMITGSNKNRSDQFTIEIDVLERESENREQFTLALTHDKKLNWLDIKDVQMSRGELHVLSELAGDEHQFIDYVINPANGKMLRHIDITPETAMDANTTRYSYIISDESVVAPSDTVVIQIRDMPFVESDERQPYIASQSVYSYEKGTVTPIPGTFQYEDDMNDLIVQDGDKLTRILQQPQRIEVTHTNLDTFTSLQQTVYSAEQLGADEIRHVFMHDGVIYVMLFKDDEIYVAALDAVNGGIVYKGQLEYTGLASQDEAKKVRQDLDVYGFSLQLLGAVD